MGRRDEITHPHFGALSLDALMRAVGGEVRELEWYAEEGLLPIAKSGEQGYAFRANAIEMVHFIRRVRRFGFSLNEIRAMASAVDELFGSGRPYICTLMQERISTLRGQISDLLAVERELREFEAHCSEDTTYLAALSGSPLGCAAVRN